MKVAVTLSGRIIRLEPPMRLLLLEITRRADGFSFKVAPADAVAISGFSLISRAPVSEYSSDAVHLQTITTAVVARFPLIGEINLDSVHEAYKIMPTEVASLITFSPGDQYSVVVVGESVHEMDVVAS
jgi:hypothetical protein